MSQPADQFVEPLGRTAPGRLSLALVESAPNGGTPQLLDQFVATARRHGAPTAHPQHWPAPAAGTAPAGTLVLTCEYPQWIDARVWPALDALARIAPLLVVLTRRPATDGPGDGATGATGDAVAGKLAGLSADARRLLQVASTIGAAFGLLELAQLMGRGTAALLPAPDEAMASGLIVGAGDLLMFGHELVRSAVEASLCRPAVLALRAERADLAPRDPTRPVGAATALAGKATGWDALSDQELQIVRLVGRALTNQQIATRIGRSRHTVNYHLRQIFRKLDIGSRVELASLAQSRAATGLRASAEGRG